MNEVAYKNAYYHNFTIGFNWWMVVAVVLVGLAIFVGIKMYKAIDGRRIRKVFNDKLFVLISAVSGVVMMLMLFIESWDGILQYLLNSLRFNESPALAVICAVMAIFFASFFFALIIYLVLLVSGWARFGYLHDKMKKARESSN